MRWAMALMLVLADGPAALAQPAGEGVPGAGAGQPVVASPILTVDQDRLFTESAFGRRVTAELEARSSALAAENREIEAQLVAEEQALTDLRPTLEPAEFRARADAFDERVQAIRAERSAKSEELTAFRTAEQERFLGSLGQVLAEIARERGALAVIDRRVLLVSADAIDVTAAAVAAMDARLGDGTQK